MRFRISGPARRDLQEIWRYTDTTWGTEQADAYIDALMSRVAWLTSNRTVWRDRSSIRPGLFSYHQGRHVILFRTGADVMDVVRALHDRMELDRHL